MSNRKVALCFTGVMPRRLAYKTKHSHYNPIPPVSKVSSRSTDAFTVILLDHMLR